MSGVDRVLRQWICRALIATVVFAQLAVAAYACPVASAAVEQARPGPVAETTMGTATDCEHRQSAVDDDASPSSNLCVQHCRQGDQSDRVATVAVPLAVLTLRYLLALSCDAAAPVASCRGAEAGAYAAASPPHSILHCCYRI